MCWDIVSVKVENHLTIAVEFADGLKGKVIFKPSHLKGVFVSLEDREYFNKVYVSNGAVTWPGELDIAPDAMHRAIKARGEWVLD